MTDPAAPSDFTAKRILHQDPVAVAIRAESHALARPQAEALSFDLYAPASVAAAATPVVLLVTGYPDPGFERLFGCAQKDMGSYVSWAQLLATSGIAAVTYRNEDPVQDALRVWDHLQENADRFGIDAQRMGVWCCSGNGPNALALLSARPACRAAALLYCYTMDEGGHSDVADAAAAFRFSNPMAGRPVAALPASTALLLVRADEDAMPGLNDSMDRLLSAARTRGLPVRCLDVPGAPHAFDTDHDHPATRRAIEAILSFYREHLLKDEI